MAVPDGGDARNSLLASIRNFGGNKTKLKKGVQTPERAAPGMAAAVTEAGEASRESASKSKGAGGGMDLMADLRARLNRRRSGIGGADAQAAKSKTEGSATKTSAQASVDAAAPSPAREGVSVDTPTALSNMQGLGTAIGKQASMAQEQETAAEWSDDD